MWCRNSKRIAFHLSTAGQQRYNLMIEIYDRFDMMTYRVPEEHYQFLGEDIHTVMPDVILLDSSIPVTTIRHDVVEVNTKEYKRYRSNENALFFGFILFTVMLTGIYLFEMYFLK